MSLSITSACPHTPLRVKNGEASPQRTCKREREREKRRTVKELFERLDIGEGGLPRQDLPEHDGIGVHVRLLRRQVTREHCGSFRKWKESFPAQRER